MMNQLSTAKCRQLFFSRRCFDSLREENVSPCSKIDWSVIGRRSCEREVLGLLLEDHRGSAVDTVSPRRASDDSKN